MKKEMQAEFKMWFMLIPAFLFLSCAKQTDSAPNITILGLSANGLPLTNNTINVDPLTDIRINFSKTIDPDLFEAACSLTGESNNPNINFSYLAATTTAILSPDNLIQGAQYTLKINGNTPIGENEEELEQDYLISFTIRDDGVINTLDPCLGAIPACLYQLSIDGSTSDFVQMYASYPLFDENYKLEDITNLVFSIHGQNRNADEYFNQCMSSLRSQGLEGSTLLIAPWFNRQENAITGELVWPSNEWRIGVNTSNGTQSKSSFSIITSTLDQIILSGAFPSLKNIMIVGHSSGATFAQLLSGVIESTDYPDIQFAYAVMNSQYFYYPEDIRWNSGLSEYTEPIGCSDFNYWPYGYEFRIDLLGSVSRSIFNDRFLSSHTTYFLGSSDIVTSGSLNTSDCAAVLLGEHRFDRGNKIFDFIKERYPESPVDRVIVNGVGHNSSQMFNSEAFKTYLRNTLN